MDIYHVCYFGYVDQRADRDNSPIDLFTQLALPQPVLFPVENLTVHDNLGSSSSSSDSSPVHSLGLDASDQAHSGSSTRDVSPRLCYPQRRAPQCRDSSGRPMHLSSHSAGPSRKRCRSSVDSVPLSTPVTGSLAPTHAYHLPPRKREARMTTEGLRAGTPALEIREVVSNPNNVPLVMEEDCFRAAREDSPDSSGTQGWPISSFRQIRRDRDDALRGLWRLAFVSWEGLWPFSPSSSCTHDLVGTLGPMG
ncbi:hypothetical protein Tco_1124076 [Tanacetum coccineum]|uniref:Uncharacterized protein n=1 Tax=Tanacetum coccineum TaxID=301880 RepID=A0ABQ5J545_9ASTR